MEAFITWVTYESDISASWQITQMSQTADRRSRKDCNQVSQKEKVGVMWIQFSGVNKERMERESRWVSFQGAAIQELLTHISDEM